MKSPTSRLHRRPSDANGSAQAWWKFVAGGGGLLAALIIVTTVTGELPDGLWLPAMMTGSAALILIAIGVVLGFMRLLHRRG